MKRLAANISRNQFAFKFFSSAIFNANVFFKHVSEIWCNFEWFVWMYNKTGQLKQCNVWAMGWSTGEFEVNSLYSDSSGDAADLHSEVCGFEFLSGVRIFGLRFLLVFVEPPDKFREKLLRSTDYFHFPFKSWFYNHPVTECTPRWCCEIPLQNHCFLSSSLSTQYSLSFWWRSKIKYVQINK